MDEKCLYHFCKCQYQLYEVPIRIYRGGKLVMKFDNYNIGEFEPNRDGAILRTLKVHQDKEIFFNIQGTLLLEGAVFNPIHDIVIYVGLARGVRITEQIARRYFADLQVTDLSDEVILRFHRYLNTLPVIAPGVFAVILSAINTFVNGNVVESRNIFENNVEAGIDPSINKKLLNQREARYFGSMNNVGDYDVENRFLFFVKNGMVRELKELCEQTPGFSLYGDISNPDAWRMTKDRCIVGIAVVSRTAMAAGLPPVEGAQLCDFYIQKAELCKTGKSLNEVRYNMLLDFTERVYELQMKDVENHIVREVSDYILEHLEEKISLSDLARRFDMNRNYLCSIFKEEMGVGITDFTNYHKVNMAKQLLRFTNKSLIEISNYLSFCSQSYFQQIFKKVTGMTPTAYRNSGDI